MELSAAGPLPLGRLGKPLLRRLSELLDRAEPGKGWRDLAQRAGSRGTVRLSPSDLEQCSLQVLEPEGSPSWSLLKLLGERGCTVAELEESLWALEHTEALQWLGHAGVKIVVQPDSQAVLPGQVVKLCCWVTGRLSVHYQWFKRDQEVPRGNSPELVLNPAGIGDSGFYICRVNSLQLLGTPGGPRAAGHASGKAVAVECAEEDFSDLQEPDPQELSGHRPVATDKVALLIGNMSYRNHPRLEAPMVNVSELTSSLRQLDFKVVSLLDLTESEMRNAVQEFLLLLDKGVYGLLYYAGHGYENDGNSFLVPVDVPSPYQAANCLCAQDVLRGMQRKETGLNIFLLDTCWKRNEHDDTVLVLDALKVTANIVFGYATYQGAEAFEVQQSGRANGIFVRFLKERLLEDKKITVLLDEVAEDMGRCPLTKGRQALEIHSSLAEKRALSDPMQPNAAGTAPACSLRWARAHELPESRRLDFQCGVRIQLGFAAEFSNVLVIYTRIVKKPPEVAACRAHVADFALDLDVDPKAANKGTPEEMGSCLVSKDLPEHCLYTRLSSLKKLKEPLTFSVCLHYEYSGMEDPLLERKEVNIGKPLVAKLGLHCGFGSEDRPRACGTAGYLCHDPVEPNLGQAAEFHPPGPCQPNSRSGIRHPNVSVSVAQPEACSCHGAARILPSGQEFWNYPAETSNVPVESTDDTVELGLLLSGSLGFSQRH